MTWNTEEKVAAGAFGLIAAAAVAGIGSGVGNAYGMHLLRDGYLGFLPGAPKSKNTITAKDAGRVLTRTGVPVAIAAVGTLALVHARRSG